MHEDKGGSIYSSPSLQVDFEILEAGRMVDIYPNYNDRLI